MKTFNQRLLQITRGCRDDMHDPETQGLRATVVGTILDNTFGDNIDVRMIRNGMQEIVVTLKRGDQFEQFNLSSLIALARVGAILSDAAEAAKK